MSFETSAQVFLVGAYKGELHGWDGWKYEGELLDGKPTGDGVAVHEDGTRIKGTWLNGQCHGLCTRTNTDGIRE